MQTNRIYPTPSEQCLSKVHRCRANNCPSSNQTDTADRVGEARRRSKKETRERGGTCGFSSTSQSHGRACGPRGRGLFVNRDRIILDKTPLSLHRLQVQCTHACPLFPLFVSCANSLPVSSKTRSLFTWLLERGVSLRACSCEGKRKEGRIGEKGGRGGIARNVFRREREAGSLGFVNRPRRERSLLSRRMVFRGESSGAASCGQPDR